MNRKWGGSAPANAFIYVIRAAESSKTLNSYQLEHRGVDIRDIISVLFLTTMKFTHRVQVSSLGILLTVCLVPGFASAQAPAPSAISASNLSAAQIVTEMQRHNLARTAALKHYHSVRHYAVEYRGFSAKIAAKMEVDADYDAASGKTFRVISQSGSKMMIDKVLKRLLESETDASKQRSTDLTSANYNFTLVGMENVDGRPTFVLGVEPLTNNKYLYRGKIWVDATDFALARIEASPAKNPSFWISSTAIHHRYMKTGGFWLPASNESDTQVRVGGKAVLTIDYGTYQVDPGSPLVAGGN